MDTTISLQVDTVAHQPGGAAFRSLGDYLAERQKAIEYARGYVADVQKKNDIVQQSGVTALLSMYGYCMADEMMNALDTDLAAGITPKIQYKPQPFSVAAI